MKVSSPVTPYQPLPFFLAAAILGILVDRLFDVPASLWGLLFAIVAVAWSIASFRKLELVSTLLILLLGFAFFGYRHHDRWSCFPENDLGHYARKSGTPATIRGIVRERPRYLPSPPPDPGKVFETQERTVLTLRAGELRDGMRWIPVDGNVSVVISGDRTDLRVGDSIQLFGTLSKPVKAQNPGDADPALNLRSRRILSVFRCPSVRSVSLLKAGSPSPARFLEGIRRIGQANLQRHMNGRTAPLAEAMILGIREGVDEDTTQELIETGTMHILAISGLHVGLLAMLLTLLLRFLGASRRTLGAVLITTVLVYLLLTDVRPPAVRATILVCVVSTALFSGRRSIGLNTLCLTALGVLLVNPTDLFQFGAQLSFLATGAFFWVPHLKSLGGFFSGTPEENEKPRSASLSDTETLEDMRPAPVKILGRIASDTMTLFLISLTIWTITMPLLLERIHVFTPIAVLVNPLLWLPMSAALIGGFATMIFGGLPILGFLCGRLADLSFEILFGLIGFFHDFGGHFWAVGPPTWWNIIFYSVFVLLTFLPIRRPSSRFLWGCLAFWIAVGVCSGYVRDVDRRRHDRLTLTLFSVGHGHCSLIVTPEGRTIVYDAGCLTSPRRATDTLSRGLWRLGKTEIDAIVISHPDKDHYNGVIHLAERFRIHAVLVSPFMFESLERMDADLRERKRSLDTLPDGDYPEERSLLLFRDTLRKRGIPLRVVAAGDTLENDGLPDSRFLHPPEEGFLEPRDSNASSLVLHFEHHGVGVILPGDLDGRLTPPFLAQEPLNRETMRCDFLVVPHHGGRSRQTEQLLEWASPKTLLISAGRFTHRETVLEDYRRRGLNVRSTFLEGMIEISIER